MPTPGLQIIDIGKFVEVLNTFSRSENEPFVLSDLQNVTPKKNPFLYSCNDRFVLSRGKYRLTQSRPISCFGTSCGLDNDLDVGYIFFESGCYDASHDDGVNYETARLRVKRRLKLDGGIVIPDCSVKLLTEYGPGAKDKPQRRDHIRYGPFWIQRDLKDVIHNDWFLADKRVA